MKTSSNIIESIGFFAILNLIFLGIMAPLASEAHYPDVVLSGFGTAAIDGIMSPGEWVDAGRIDYLANVPSHDGGGTTPATLFVMNDETNIYIALKIKKFAARSTSAFFEFDNNHNGVWPEEGDDGFGMNVGTFTPPTFSDLFRTTQPPCPSGFCGLLDTDFGGTTDGASAATNDDEFTYIEISHPLNSNDDLHDFSLNSGDVVGFHHSLRMFSLDLPCNSGPDCYADTEFPPLPFFGDIVIAEQPSVKATIRIKPETLNLGRKGVFTAFVTLPEEYDIEDININTVECNGASAIWARSFYHLLIVKFRTTELVGIEPSDDVVLTVMGNLYDGTIFSGADTVRVIDPRRHRKADRPWGNMNRCEHNNYKKK